MQYDPIAGWTADQVREADVLLVRTTNPVNSTTLPENSRVRFVATASAGRDHLDEAWLNRLGITVADAKGSNARSVAEYVAVAVLSACEALEIPPSELTAGVVGAGFTGSAAADLLEKIGVGCKRYDPPRQERELESSRDSGSGSSLEQPPSDPSYHTSFRADSRSDSRSDSQPSSQPSSQPDFRSAFRSASLEEVLGCDILTLHVPLEHNGPHATRHWLDEHKLATVPKTLVINASRGGVMDEGALLAAQQRGIVRMFACDVWENEPVFSDTTAISASLATPHIAGYSIQAKRNASEMMCTALHRFLGLNNPEPATEEPQYEALPDRRTTLRDVLGRLHPVFSYDSSLRQLIGMPDRTKGPAFLRLRQDMPLRNEFQEIGLDPEMLDRHPVLNTLGFRATQTGTS